MIDNVVLKVWKYNSDECTQPLQNICTNIKLYCTFKNICTELQFSIAYDYNDYDWFNFEVGDEVVMWYNSLKVFYGKITDTTFNQKTNLYTFTCYDFTWWLAKNNISYNFDNISAFSAVNIALKDVLLPSKYHAADDDWKNIMIGSHLIKNKSTKDVLQAIMGSVTKITGKYYYIHMSYYDGLVQITEADKYYSGLTIQKSSDDVVDGNLIDYTITRSMQNMVNMVRIYDENYCVKDTVWAYNENRYGTLQDTIVLDENTDFAKAKDQAEKKIENYGQPSEEVIVKCLGDINYRVGYGVMVKLPDSYFYDRFMYIISSEWQWNKDGTFISTLSLSNSNKHELTEWEDIEEVKKANEDGTGGAGSESVESAVQWMINIANNDIHGYDQNSRWGPDYDCSSLVIAGYQQAGIQLKSNGANSTHDMKDVALKIGFEEVKWNRDMNNLKRGDILLNEAHHVACYIGNGQMVSAHHNENGNIVGGKTGDQTGHEIDVSSFKDYPWDCVLRYKVEEKDDNTTPIGGNLNSAASATSQSQFATMVAPYAQQLYKKYHIFAGVQIACMIQESWTGSGFTKLAKNDYNFGGIKTSDSSKAATDYKPPASEGSMLYRKFGSVAEYMEYFCKMLSGGFGGDIGSRYKRMIADKTTPIEQMNGFTGSGYAGDSSKAKQMISIYNSLNLSQYDG